MEPNFKARLMARKHTKKSSLWKGIRYEGTHGNPVQIGRPQTMVSKPMKIDSPTPKEKAIQDEKSVNKPSLPTRWISENIDKLATGAKTVGSFITKGAKMAWKRSPSVAGGIAIGDYIGMKTGIRDKDPNTMTGSRALDMTTYPLNVMWKATKKWEQKREDTKKGQYRDTYAGIVARDS
tara:strand:- start:658 stop:1194 length:537 start_codon:yes stop_codon:yes gene_type:complete